MTQFRKISNQHFTNKILTLRSSYYNHFYSLSLLMVPDTSSHNKSFWYQGPYAMKIMVQVMMMTGTMTPQTLQLAILLVTVIS